MIDVWQFSDNPGQNHWLHYDKFDPFEVPHYKTYSTLIGGGKGEVSLLCSDAHNIIASVVNVLTRIVSLLDDLKKLKEY